MGMNIKKGDLLFVYGNSFIDHAIEHVTHGASHVAMFVDDGRTLCEAQGGREIGEVGLSFYLDKKCRLEVWHDPTLTDNERVKIVEYAKMFYGEGYDYPLILFQLFHFELGLDIEWYRENHHLICSTYMALLPKKVKKKWSHSNLPAPYDLQHDGYLKYKFTIKE
jgi:hypothetical protein